MDEATIEEYLSNLPPELQAITRELIAVARKNMPGAHEFIYHDYVNFGFFFGGNLPDPKQLLTGKGKRMRHVKVRSVDDAKNPALGNLIMATWKEAPQSIAKIHAARKKIKS